jgi:prepilin-type N-terminal cleavage/methylation domain-containing protein
MKNIARNQNGFTLIEIIVTLVVAAILGAMVAQFVGRNLARSAEPIVMLQKGFTINQIMESMTADYRKLNAEDDTPLVTFKGYVEAGNVEGNTPYYGDYSWQTAYITFQSGAEVVDSSGDNRVLRVTLTHGQQTLSALFTR